MKNSVETEFVSSYYETNRLLLYMSMTVVVMELMTQTLFWKSDIPVIIGSSSSSHVFTEFEISEVVIKASAGVNMQ
jgi:hypothetical protein